MNQYRHFFADGQWHPATGIAELTQSSPVTEEPISRLTTCSAADVELAVTAARRAAVSWASSPLDQRRRALQSLHRALAQRTEAFVEMLAFELGVPTWVGRSMQVPMPLGNLEAMIEGLDQIVWEERIRTSRVVREPVGMIAAITPWNFPLHQIVAKIGGAIGAGCATVLKPSEMAPGVAQLFIEASAETDLPPGVVNMVWGDAQVGEQLVSHPAIDLISFTGSNEVGQRILVGAAPALKRTVMELGGKSAALVLDDADFDAAIPAVLRRCLVNSGQTCVAQSRLLVPRIRQAETLERIVAGLGEWPLGPPEAPDTRLGPLATARQFSRVNHHIEAARSTGAWLVAGGPGRAAGFERGWFVAPTVFADVTPAMALAQEEVFGPVLSVMPYEDEEDGIAIANSTPFGLSGGVWSADPARATTVARRIRAGQVIVNGAASNPAAPFGGFGASGFGRENGRFSIEAFLELKSIHGGIE